MKYISLIPMAIFSLTLQGQTGNVASGTPQATHQVAVASVSAELTKRIDTKNAKQGDEVDARVTSTAKLPDGTELPRGTKLVGTITDVKAKSKEDKRAHLAFNIDHAVMKDGRPVPVMVAVISVTGPTQSAGGDMMTPGGGGGSAAGGSSGGGATGSSGMAGSSAPAPSPVMSGGGQSQGSAGGVLKSAQDHVPVGNMPGVMLSAGSGPGSAGSLDASGDNINLDSGTKLTLNVAPGGAPAGQ